MKRLLTVVVAVTATLSGCARSPAPLASADDPSRSAGYRDFDQHFTDEVRPLLAQYCFGCHSGPQPASMLDLAVFDDTREVVESFGTWEHVLGRLERTEMPPRNAAQPTVEERRRIIEWIEAIRAFEARRNAGDPGIVLARRLSNAEFNYTVQDLTGVDIRPTREFPVDPANEAGFDNTGETLALSPALLTKYLDAARAVSEHIVFKPYGFDFAPHVMVTDPDRDRYVVNRIMDFYRRQPLDLADYFYALWRFENRSDLGIRRATLETIAQEEGVSPSYLARVAGVIENREGAYGPMAELHRQWDQLPAASSRPTEEEVRAATGKMRDYVVDIRKRMAWRFEVQRARPLHIASQMVMHANRQGASHHRLLNPSTLISADTANPRAANYDPDLVIPAEPTARAAAMRSLEAFADVFPDAFLISERTSTWLARNQTGRLLSAGFHGAMGYFRDDQPLYDLILDDEGRRELDELWRELDFISNAPERQLAGFVWFERTDSDFMLSEEFNHIRAEDQDLSSEEKFSELRRLYEAKVVASGLGPDIQAIVKLFFDELGSAIRATEVARRESESYHLESLLEFAERSYRRPLSQIERDDLLGFYRQLRTDGLSHEDAIRDAVASVLVSPEFSYRVDLIVEGPRSRIGDHTVAPLTSYALANRLSYFLWSSMPDRELLEHAAAGDLSEPAVLLAQTRRMLRDPRATRLATEFGTNWLGVRRFEEFNSVDRSRFPSFDNDLREAFFQEPIQFLGHLIQEDRPVTDLLFGDYTYVNPQLAQHYSIPIDEVQPGEWVRVEQASQYGRGGLLPMAVFLTQTSPGLRTSPVKRGYWLAKNVLGQHIPPPPPNVPELPADEAELGELTLAQTLERHRSDPACASCHATFDFFGLAYEGYGPIGETRDRDLGGRPVEPVAAFPDGTERTGLPGILTYLQQERQDEFVDNFSRRLLTYALGRGLLLSDDPLVEEMQRALRASDYRFSSLVETIVTSPQFLMKRVTSESVGAEPTL